jgi:ubiquinone/menaquinone biosynthesis C-methylase UbiE
MQKEKSKWIGLYAKYIQAEYKSWDEYFTIKMKLKKRFLNLIIKHSTPNKPVLECGAGTGKFSVYLASLGFNTYAIDLEHEMVEHAKQLSELVCHQNPVKVFQGNISSIPFHDKFFAVSHSSGVLEHFSDSKIVELINEQLRVADTIVFSVPSCYFEKKMQGNERFLTRQEWRNIISNSKAKIVKETGYHYKTLKSRLYDNIKNPKQIFKPIALFTFVLKEK